MNLGGHRRDWEDLATTDPLWAILSDPDKRHGGWDIDEFFATGAAEMGSVLARARELGLPQVMESALDFGCGVGRVTRAMASAFERTIGVDVSAVMIDRATELNREVHGLRFLHNDRAHLRVFDDRSFDFVYSFIVLQHVPGAATIEGYVREFVRILRPGGLLVFQLPAAIRWRNRLQPRRRAYAILRCLGAGPELLGGRLELSPIRMSAIPESRIAALLASSGGSIVAADRQTDGPFRNVTYWVTVGAEAGRAQATER